MRFSFVLVEKAFYPIAVLCRVLQVSRSGFYEWAKRKESARGLRNAALTVKVAQAHAKSRGIYGSPRVRDELREGGEVVGRKLVARLMRAHGLQGCRPRRYKATTDSAHGLPVPENLVARDFAPAGPDLLWVADITYIWTWEGWLYLAVVLDLWSRRVVGWSMAEHMRSELVVDALEMALGHRVPAHGHVFHSDRGSQYASYAHRDILKANGILCSMSRKGNCWDNACAESFFATLKTELIHRQPWPTRTAARLAIHEYIGVFYNRKRRHSFLGHQGPVDFEDAFHEKEAMAA